MSYSADKLLPALDAADQVTETLFRRHLGVPTCAEFDNSLQELLDKTRHWYSEHGRPRADARYWGIQRYVYDLIHLDGQGPLGDPVLARGLDRVAAHALVVVAVSAGTAVSQRINELSQQQRPDEAMFLNSYALATVEHRLAAIQSHLRALFAEEGVTVLPHYSAGYGGWNDAEQRRLLRLVQGSIGSADHPRALAVFGLTRRTDFDEPLDQYWTCRVHTAAVNGPGARYAFPERALRRWSDERLKLKALADNRLSATFRFEGTTCSNMGAPLVFDYELLLQRSAGNGFQIVDSCCAPLENHTGYEKMCAYLEQGDRFTDQLTTYCPLDGKLLSDALTWEPTTSPAGCLCTRASQDHKWRIVLQTINYALHRPG